MKEAFGKNKVQFQTIFTYFYECYLFFSFLLLMLESKLHTIVGMGSYRLHQFQRKCEQQNDTIILGNMEEKYENSGIFAYKMSI